jgi:hypothetical protein
MAVLQADRFADESYEKVSAYFDALLKGLTDLHRLAKSCQEFYFKTGH